MSAMLKKPVRISLARQVLEEMERNIHSGNWPVGGRIPPEPELIRHFGVSRNTVREAVQSLIHAGMLEARPGDGTYVLADDRFEVALDSRLRGVDFSKILEARLALEKEIARLAALNRTEEDLARLKSALDKRNVSRNDNAAADLAFHAAVASATGNPILIDLYRSISRSIAIVMKAWIAENPFDPAEVAAHNELYEAIRDQAPARAEAATFAIIAFDRALPASR